MVPCVSARCVRSPDAIFYSTPRLVTHIDDAAIRALTKYYETALPPPNTPNAAVLDMCSSWVCPSLARLKRPTGLRIVPFPVVSLCSASFLWRLLRIFQAHS